MPEEKPTSTLSNLNVSQRDTRIRLSWQINKKERTNVFKKYYQNSYKNESERSLVFGKGNKHYKKLKKRLPKTALDSICKWYEKNYDNLIERNKALNFWYDDQFENGIEKSNAFSKLNNSHYLQDYFLIKESHIPIDCNYCSHILKKSFRVLFSSKSIIREDNQFFYYLDIPKNNQKYVEYQISHYGPDDELFSTDKKTRFKRSKLFPKIPVPRLKIIQIENEGQSLQYAFGRVVLKNIIQKENSPKKNENKKQSLNEISKLEQNRNSEIRKFSIRLSWPQIIDISLKRLKGKGDFFEKQEYFLVNLYRKRNGEKWDETPINLKYNTNNYFIDKLKLYKNDSKQKLLKDSPNDNFKPKIPFYIDLRGQNGDTWLYQLRLVDRFGNESLASETVTVNLKNFSMNGQNLIEKDDVP